jgi:hypothetical protein
MIHHLIFLIIQSVTRSGTIHNIRTIAPCYGELLAYWFINEGLVIEGGGGHSSSPSLTTADNAT